MFETAKKVGQFCGGFIQGFFKGAIEGAIKGWKEENAIAKKGSGTTAEERPSNNDVAKKTKGKPLE